MVGKLCFEDESDCEVKHIQEFEQDNASVVAPDTLHDTRDQSSLTSQPLSHFDIGIMGFGELHPRYLSCATTKGFVPPEPHVPLPSFVPYLSR